MWGNYLLPTPLVDFHMAVLQVQSSAISAGCVARCGIAWLSYEKSDISGTVPKV